MDMFPWLFPGIAFLLGTIGGSFINALLFRLNTGKGMGGRSQCTSCGKEILARDLIPILSWLVLKGRCRFCKTKIAATYPIVEFIGGLLLVGVWYTAPNLVSFALGSLIWLILLAVAVYDLRHLIIPDVFSLTLGVVALLFAVLQSGTVALPSVYALVAGPLLALPLLALWGFSKGRAMGLGDPKLMLGIGWFLGVERGVAALLFSFWVGALVSILLLMRSFEKRGKRLTMRSEVPFGPFLIAGAAIAYFTNVSHALFTALFL